MADLYHITRDGEYVTGIKMSIEGYSSINQSKLRISYEGCHAWCKNGEDWYNTPAVAIGFARWEGAMEKDVPEVVRIAEIVR